MKRQIFGYIPVNIANLIVSFGTIVILTRLLDADEFGRYALAIALMHFVHMSVYTWVEAAMSRFYARAEQDGNLPSHIKTLYAAALMIIAICLPILILIIYSLPIGPQMRLVLTLGLVTSGFNLIYNVGREAHKAAHRIARYSIFHTGNSICGFAIGVLLVLVTPLREAGPFVGLLIAVMVTLLIDLPFMLSRTRSAKVDPVLGKKYLLYGLPICLSLLFSYALSQGDLFFIKYYMGDAAVGGYNAGYNLANRSLDVGFAWLGMAMTPILITQLETLGEAEVRRSLKSYAETLIVLLLPVATGIALVADQAGFIVGEAVRADAVSVMPWIAFAGLLNGAIIYYINQAFVLSKRTGVMAWLMITPVFLNFALNIILIPQFGLRGAVWATLLAYGLAFILSLAVSRKYFRLPLPVRTLVQCAGAAALMALAVIFTPTPENLPDVVLLMIKAFIGAAVYVGCVLTFNIADYRTILKTLIIKFRT